MKPTDRSIMIEMPTIKRRVLNNDQSGYTTTTTPPHHHPPPLSKSPTTTATPPSRDVTWAYVPSQGVQPHRHTSVSFLQAVGRSLDTLLR